MSSSLDEVPRSVGQQAKHLRERTGKEYLVAPSPDHLNRAVYLRQLLDQLPQPLAPEIIDHLLHLTVAARARGSQGPSESAAYRRRLLEHQAPETLHLFLITVAEARFPGAQAMGQCRA